MWGRVVANQYCMDPINISGCFSFSSDSFNHLINLGLGEKVGNLKLLNFEREGWRDAVQTLRKIADDLESGEIAPCATGVLSMRSDDGQVTVYGFGPKADDLQSLAMFRLGEQKLIDVLLDS